VRKLFPLLVLAMGTWLAVAERCSAQGQSRPPGRGGYSDRIRRPAVSPYLNLYRGGSRGLPNYYTLVRPQLDQLDTNSRERQAVADLDRSFANEIQRRERQSLPETGHEVRYRYFSHFYNREQ
jgi:hypothetical protein